MFFSSLKKKTKTFYILWRKKKQPKLHAKCNTQKNSNQYIPYIKYYF